MRTWRLRLVREGTPDIHAFYKADTLPEMIAEAWLKNHPSAIARIPFLVSDATYKFVNGPMVYLRSLG